MTVKQLIKGLKKYHRDMKVYQGGVEIKAMRIWVYEEPEFAHAPGELVVRLIRKDEKRN